VANTGVLNRGWVFRLETTPGQNIALLAQTDGRRGIWNMLHEWWQMSSSHHLPSTKDLDTVVRQGRKDIDWMAAVPAQAAQQVIRDYLGAWRKCWAGHGTVGPPRFRSRHRDRPSLDAPQARDLCITRISDKFSTINIAKIGKVTFRRHRAIPSSARITGATLAYSQGHWWVALRMQLRRPTPLPTDRPPVGADRGITIPVALSDATFVDHPDWLTPAEKRRMLLLERRCARQRHHRWDTRGKRTPLGGERSQNLRGDHRPAGAGRATTPGLAAQPVPLPRQYLLRGGDGKAQRHGHERIRVRNCGRTRDERRPETRTQPRHPRQSMVIPATENRLQS